MKRIFISLALILLILPSVLSINISVEKESTGEVLIADIDRPVIFDLKITNNGPDDNFGFYNLLGFNLFPIGTTPIAKGETKDIQLQISLLGSIKERGIMER